MATSFFGVRCAVVRGRFTWAHSHISRRRSFASSALRSLKDSDVEAFRAMMSYQPGSVLTESDEIERYNTDWTVSFYIKWKSFLAAQKTYSHLSFGWA